MKPYLRLLNGLIGALVLCVSQLATTAHAGIGGATFRVNLSVTTTPSSTVQPTVNGSFTYGITCTAPSGPVFTFASPAITIPINVATPTAAVADVTRGSSVSAPNTCTVVQLTRPVPPAGFAWNNPPPGVVLSNVLLTDPTTVYPAAFANVLTLPTVTGVANPTTGGTVTCTPLSTVGGNSTCIAAANSGYTFSSFVFTTGGCGAASTATPGTFSTTPVTANCTVTAAFAQNPLTVTSVANPPAGGTVTCTSPVNSGAPSSCTATGNSGYTFAGFTTSGCGAASANNPYTTSPVTANCTVTAAFTQNPFIITAIANPLAGGTITCTSPVTFGTSSNCTATANSGYAFTGVTTSSCGSPNVSSPFSTAAVTSNCTVTATFSVNTVPVTTAVNIAAGGSVSCTPNPVVVGSTSTCSIVTNAGYVLTGVGGCGGATTTPGTFVTAPITAACSVAAAFAPFVIAPAVQVPTLGGWMLILLTLLVVGIGGAICARRLS